MSKKKRHKKESSVGEVISTAILIIAICVFVFCAYQLTIMLVPYYSGGKEYDDVKKLALTVDKNEEEDGEPGYTVDFDALLKLPGVGRKSANLIMGDVFGKPAIVTDTHCIRLVNRMVLVKDIKEPKKVEMELWKIIPPEEGNDFCHRLVEHGRDVCTARTNPHCDRCVLNDICATGKKLMKAEQKTK